MKLKCLILSIMSFIYSECNSYEVELWGLCYSIENTTAIQYLDHTSGVIPEDICLLTNLEILNLTIIWGNSNFVTGEIPDCIGELENLTYLDLSWNQLYGEIPESIGNLTNLCCSRKYCSSYRAQFRCYKNRRLDHRYGSRRWYKWRSNYS